MLDTVTEPLFYSLEATTLEHLYPQQEDWWEYWYVLSDAVEERNPVAADFMRWLYQWKQRPFDWGSLDPDDPSRYWWWSHPKDSQVLYWRSCNDYIHNYLPFVFDAVCKSGSRDASFTSLPTALTAAAKVWCRWGTKRRAGMWTKWVGDGSGNGSVTQPVDGAVACG